MSETSQNPNATKTPEMDLDEIMSEVRALHQGLNQATEGAAMKPAAPVAAAQSPNLEESSIESIIEDVAQDLADLSAQQVAQTSQVAQVTEAAPVQTPEVAAVVAEVPAAVTPVVTASVAEESLAIPMPVESDAPLEEMLVGLKSDTQENQLATVTPIYESKLETTGEVAMKSVSEPKSTTTEAESSLAIQLSGSMSVKLKYECDGQEVQISFAEQCLKVQFTDGTEFKIPVARGAKARQAA